MSKKIEDSTEESKINHIKYYKSLTNVIENIQNEMKTETEVVVIKHLQSRIEAINLDKKRIRDMFPDMQE
ncbi:MAG: hypothetical protein ITD33_05855 [Nitrosarchaeum sp.]|nr:hypothetical protein [Nitrosarchaeum sp.]MBP0120360.1 hypothetical protein [Nitrosarchaeum sp.]MBP0133367.1 hypothetical protein [Nitrosarchaeum sp.]